MYTKHIVMGVTPPMVHVRQQLYSSEEDDLTDEKGYKEDPKTKIFHCYRDAIIKH